MQKHFSISLDVYATAQKERPFSGNHFPRTAFPRFYVSAVYDYSTSENSSFPTPLFAALPVADLSDLHLPVCRLYYFHRYHAGIAVSLQILRDLLLYANGLPRRGVHMNGDNEHHRTV